MPTPPNNTPESVAHYAAIPGDCWELQALDTMRGYLATDAITQGYFYGIIRDFPVTAQIATDGSGTILPPTAALFSALEFNTPHETLGNRGIGTTLNTLACTLQLSFAINQFGSSADYLGDLQRRAWNCLFAFKQGLVRYQQDPGTPSLWLYLHFPTGTREGSGVPTQAMHLQTQQLLIAYLNFTITTRLYIPA